MKESDRIAAVVANLRAVGADAEELPDGLRVARHDRPLRGTRSIRTAIIASRWRSAFSARIRATRSRSTDPDCVAVSYPRLLGRLCERVRERDADARGRHRDRRTGGVGQVVDRAVGRRAARVPPRRFGLALPRRDRARSARRTATPTRGPRQSVLAAAVAIALRAADGHRSTR